MEIKRVDLKDYTPLLTLDQILKGRSKNDVGDRVTYNYTELTNLISLLTVLKMVGDNDKTKHTVKTLRELGSNNLPLVNIIRAYIYCQLKVVNEVSKTTLEELLAETHPFEINTNRNTQDALVAFAFYENLENITLLRMSEFGYFCIRQIAMQMFRDIPKEKVLLFNKKLYVWSGDSIVGNIDKQIFKSPKSITDNLDNVSYRFLLRLFNNSYSKGKINTHIAYQFGLDIMLNINYFNTNWKQLKQTVELVVDNSLRKNKRKGLGL